MITGTGSLIEVSSNNYPDLWWGMRGAGFNFGIVTSATYKVYDFTNDGYAMNADLRFAGSKNASVYAFAKSFEGEQPDDFYIDIAIAYNESFGGVSQSSLTASPISPTNKHIQQTYISVNLIYAGPLQEGRKLIQPMLDLGPFQSNITSIPWKDLDTSSRFGADSLACIKGHYHSYWGLNLYTINVPSLINAVNYMDSVYKQYLDFRRAFLALDMFANRVIKSVPDEETAYPYRHAIARL